MKFLDWQIFWYGPPINDITYFFYANASEDMYDNLEQYKNVYYNSLIKQLKSLNVNPNLAYPRDKFEDQMKHHARYGMSMALILMQIKLFKDDMKDHEDLEGTNESMIDQFRCEGKDLTELYKLTNVLVRHCYKNGFI